MNNILPEYEKKVLSAFKETQKRKSYKKIVEEALSTSLYNPTIEKYLTEAIAITKKEKDIPSGITQITKEELAEGIQILSKAANQSEANYFQDNPDIKEDQNFKNELEKLKQNIQDGKICGISEQFWMSKECGEAQVKFADEELSLNPRVQLLLAGINYASFTKETMSTGKNTFEEKEYLKGWNETQKEKQDKMPHLEISNIAIGKIVGTVFEKCARPLIIIDHGSGSGGTLAGSVLGICEKDNTKQEKSISFLGIEGTKPYYEELENEFTDFALDKLLESGVNLQKQFFPENNNGTKIRISAGNWNIAYSSILEGTKKISIDKTMKNAIVLITANYVWHRLPTKQKEEIIQRAGNQTENVLFLIADLARNGSVVNRSYFNFRDNGLLNCGNLGLKEIFENNNFSLKELDRKTASKFMDPNLSQKFEDGTTSDSFFTSLTKGMLYPK